MKCEFGYVVQWKGLVFVLRRSESPVLADHISFLLHQSDFVGQVTEIYIRYALSVATKEAQQSVCDPYWILVSCTHLVSEYPA